MKRVLFVNAGIMGHSSVARVIEAAFRGTDVQGTHENLSENLTVRDRVIRRAMCMKPLRRDIFGRTNLDLERWRAEMHVGVLAARRIRARERRGERFDVLHFHPQPCAYSSVARMRRTPSIVSIDSTQYLASQEATSALERLTYWPNAAHDGFVFRAARAIVATSRWVADDVARHYPECAGKIDHIPWPVGLDGFDPGLASARAERARRGEPLRFLFMGGDFERKGGMDLLEAWRAARLPAGARLEIVTSRALDPSIVPPDVEVTRGIAAYTPAWYDVWRRADVFVMPSRAEAFGIVYQEAAAAGLPVVATSINAIPELVRDGESGILVKPRDVAAIAAALERLAADADLRSRMGAAGRLKIEREGRPQDYARRLLSVIERVATPTSHGEALHGG